MDTIKAFLIALFLIPLLDAPWLWLQLEPSRAMLRTIQGGADVKMRYWPAILVYVALAFLLLQQTSVVGAALHGSAVYAVYDFTNLLTFKDYQLSFAIKDTLWGGVLFGTAYYIMTKAKLL